MFDEHDLTSCFLNVSADCEKTVPPKIQSWMLCAA
jgi:hypothetical protein